MTGGPGRQPQQPCQVPSLYVTDALAGNGTVRRRRPRIGVGEHQVQVADLLVKVAVIDGVRPSALRALRSTARACWYCASGRTGSWQEGAAHRASERRVLLSISR